MVSAEGKIPLVQVIISPSPPCQQVGQNEVSQKWLEGLMMLMLMFAHLIISLVSITLHLFQQLEFVAENVVTFTLTMLQLQVGRARQTPPWVMLTLLTHTSQYLHTV